MNALAELSQTEQQIRDIKQRLSYMLERAVEIESGERRVEQRFGVFLDANYYRVNASELKYSLTSRRQENLQ
jgi:hypothetical protein